MARKHQVSRLVTGCNATLHRTMAAMFHIFWYDILLVELKPQRLQPSGSIAVLGHEITPALPKNGNTAGHHWQNIYENFATQSQCVSGTQNESQNFSEPQQKNRRYSFHHREFIRSLRFFDVDFKDTKQHYLSVVTARELGRENHGQRWFMNSIFRCGEERV